MNKDALFDVGSNYDNNRYTNIIPKIQYVPKTRCKPSEISLYNLEKYNNLVKEIKSKNLDSEIEKLGYKYFIELDDDYTSFLFRFGRAKSVNLKKSYIDNVFNIYLDFYEINTKIKILAFMQGGDFSDIRNGKVLRKSMNALFCSTDRRVIFNGRLNEDVNAYTRQNNIGNICISLPFVQLCQRQTQSGNGMSETYLKYGTYTKSFYSVIQNPSCIKISILQSPTSYRIHHQINHRFCDAKIISYRFKK